MIVFNAIRGAPEAQEVLLRRPRDICFLARGIIGRRMSGVSPMEPLVR